MMTADFPAARRHALALGLVILPHLILAGLLLRQTGVREKRNGAGRIELVFITPVVKNVPTLKPAQTVLEPQTKAASVKPPRIVAEPTHAPPTPAVEIAEAPRPAETKAETTIIDTAALIGMAGKIDREVRPPGENLLSGTEGKSLRKKMDEAFAAAHLAVPLKWYEAARVELFSAENDPAKIYQVKTAIGTYCLFYADRVKNPDASPQPRIAGCPKRF